jgi:hypothetical protein
MILAKARVIEGSNGTVRIGLTFPTGFDPDEVVEDSVRVDGNGSPESVSVRPRRGTVDDIYREFEVSIPVGALEAGEGGARLEITGRMRRGLTFTASVPRRPAAAAAAKPTDH